MDPNSANQVWSKWVWIVKPQRFVHSFAVVQQEIARFTRKGFGSGSQMRITDYWDPEEQARLYKIELETEGKPAHDPAFVEYMRASYEKFFRNGFGQQTTVRLQVKLLAGSRQDGSPRDQWIALPAVSIN